MKLSFLVTTHNEESTLDMALSLLVSSKEEEDEIIVLDDFSTNPKTKKILEKNSKAIRVLQHTLGSDYSAHKNYGTQKCSGDWVMQIDGDEIPSLILLQHIKNIIEVNPEVELFFVPRLNIFRGVTKADATQWGWTLTQQDNQTVVNFPDVQGRIYKREYPRIKWQRRLHESIEGHTIYGSLPSEPKWAFRHLKTIEQQRQTNLRYNQMFTEQENRGYMLPV